MLTPLQIIALVILVVAGLIALILAIKARRSKAGPVDKPINTIEHVEPASREVNRRAKIGDYIKLLHPVYRFDSAGDVLKVTGQYGNCEFVSRQGRIFPYSQSVYTVLEGYTPPTTSEKPNLVTVTPPVKITSNEALTAVNRNRSATARVRAENAAWDLQTGRSREDTAKDAGYKSVDSMRKCMAKYGFKMPKLPKEVKG